MCYIKRKVISLGTCDVESYAPLGIWTSISFLDIRTHICLLSLDINLPDPISIELEVLVGWVGGTTTSRNVVFIRTEDVEYGVKFGFLIEVTKVPKLNPATATTRCEYGRRKPQCGGVRIDDV